MTGAKRTFVETLHVHLFGSPGVGKSSLAGEIYARLKAAGICAELVPEYAKELEWQGRLGEVPQMMISAEQFRREFELRRFVPVLVCESPPLLGVAYTPIEYREQMRHILTTLQQGWWTLPYLLEREFSNGYERRGRRESREESLTVATEIRRVLDASGVSPRLLRARDDVTEVSRIADAIVGDVRRALAASEPVPGASPSRPRFA